MASGLRIDVSLLKPGIIEKQVTWTGNFLRSSLIRFRNSSGNVFSWEAFQRVGCNGIVAVVPFTSDGLTILTRQYRPPVDKYVIEFPAGLNDRNETLEEVARRELLEETGYQGDSLEFLCEGPLLSGASSEIMTVFMVRNAVNTGEQLLDGIEEIEIIKLPVDGFLDALFSLQDKDTLIDLKIPGLFELAKKYKD